MTPHRFSCSLHQFCAVSRIWMAALLLSGVSFAEDAKTQSAPDQGVIKLFDGKSLKNWEISNFGGEAEVHVKDGNLILERGEPITGINWKGKELPRVNYEVSMQAKRIDGNDFFATLTFPVQENYCSLVLGGWGGGVIGLSNLDGADASENETTDYMTFEKDRWYKIRVRVTEHHILAWIDEKQVANVDYSDKSISVRIEMELSKPLGLASFQTVGAIKDFQLRPLSTTEINNIENKQANQ